MINLQPSILSPEYNLKTFLTTGHLYKCLLCYIGGSFLKHSNESTFYYKNANKNIHIYFDCYRFGFDTKYKFYNLKTKNIHCVSEIKLILAIDDGEIVKIE